MTEFTHLHTHSYYSLLDGLSSPKDLVKCARRMGSKSLALTDHGTCAGLYNFQKACKEEGIKPILGMEGYITADHTVKEKGTSMHHILLLAKNKTGYQNLIHLSSKAYLEGFYYKPRIDFDLLQKHHEGLIVGSACCAGEIPCFLWNGDEKKAIEVAGKFKDVFGDDFYIEIMTHVYYLDKQQEDREKKLAGMLYKLSKEMNIKAICTQDIHYAYKNQWYPQDVLLSIQTRNSIKNPDRMSFNSKDFYMKPAEEMALRYKAYPQLLSNTIEIADKIEENLIESSEDLLPNFNLPEGFKNEEEYLKDLLTDGMKEKNLIKLPKYRKRIKYEMGIISQCGFIKYFLILWDIINFANTNDIRVGIGRGCFLPDQKVVTNNGYKNIQDIKKRDEVLAYDGEFHEVLKTNKYIIEEDIMNIEMEDGRRINCTLDHKIHVLKNGQLKWIEAQYLNEQDEIFDINVG